MYAALRSSLRQFRHHPSMTFLIVSILGLAIGAAITVYTVLDAVVLQPLPYRDPGRLVALWDTHPERGLTHEPISPVTFMDYRALASFEDAAAWWRPDVNLVDAGLEPARVPTIEVSPNLFSLLGVPPQLGAGFPAEPALFSRDRAVVISARLWRARYSADLQIIGRQLRLNDTPYTVVGVMPDGFDYPGNIDVWQRLSWDMTQHSRFAHFMEGVARLRPGVTLDQARAEAATLATKLGTDFRASNQGWTYQLAPLLDDQLGYYRPALVVMFGAVGLLLVIGCLNVASLLLTRALAREREMAVRTALGATRRQLLTQLLTESFVLSACGALLGLVVTAVALPMILALVPVAIPRLSEAGINGRVVAIAVATTAFTTIGFGLVPALVLLRRQLGTRLRSGDRSSSRSSRRAYHGLVGSEVALACALLIASALLVRTVQQMSKVELGVSGDDVVVSSVQFSGGAYEAWPRVADAHTALLARLRTLPGVTSAGATNFLPFETGWRNPFFMNDVAPPNQNEAPTAQQHVVSDGYFDTMGARLIEGRYFTAADVATGEGVAIVNEAFMDRYAGGRPMTAQRLTTYSSAVGPLGRNLMARAEANGHRRLTSLAIVGVVGNVRNGAAGQPIEPAIYFPAAQFPFRSEYVVVKARDAATAAGALRQALREVAPTTPLGPVETWAGRRDRRLAEPRVLMATLTGFGVLAAILAALGVYGLFSWSVAARRRELAIRLTLGARPARIGAVVLRQGFVLVATGLIVGWGLVRLLESALSRVLFEVAPTDARATMTAAGALLAASLLACVPAARRAMRIDPVEGLRGE